MVCIDTWSLTCHSFFDKINTLKKEKVENLNQIFSEVQRDMKSVSKSTAKEATRKTQVLGLSCILRNIIDIFKI